MTVKLNVPVLYRGRNYRPGEPIEDVNQAQKTAWSENGFILEQEVSEIPPEEPETKKSPSEDTVQEETKAKDLVVNTETAIGSPGKKEDGTGAEGEIPGRSSKVKKGGSK